jgi:hypothetical protein
MTLIFAVVFLAPAADTYLKEAEAKARFILALVPVNAISVNPLKFEL